MASASLPPAAPAVGKGQRCQKLLAVHHRRAFKFRVKTLFSLLKAAYFFSKIISSIKKRKKPRSAVRTQGADGTGVERVLAKLRRKMTEK